MSDYKYVTAHDSPNFTPARDVPRIFGRARVVEGITIHWWGDPDTRPTHSGVRRYLCRPGGDSSAHEVISAGLVSCIVDPDDAAWHAGDAIGNATTIGLELDPRATDAVYATAAARIAAYRKTYGDLPLYPHNRWQNTACPGVYDLDRLDRMARAVADGKPAPKPKPSKPKPSGGKKWPHAPLKVTKKHTAASHAAWVTLLAAVGYRDRDLTKNFQRWLTGLGYYNGRIDGVFGPYTVHALQRKLADDGLYRGRLDAFQAPYAVARGPLMVAAEIGYLNDQRRYLTD